MLAVGRSIPGATAARLAAAKSAARPAAIASSKATTRRPLYKASTARMSSEGAAGAAGAGGAHAPGTDVHNRPMNCKWLWCVYLA